jgi:hypothetical protein
MFIWNKYYTNTTLPLKNRSARGHFPSSLLTKTQCIFLISLMRAIYLTHRIFLDFNIFILFDKCKLWSSLCSVPQPLGTLSLLGPTVWSTFLKHTQLITWTLRWTLPIVCSRVDIHDVSGVGLTPVVDYRRFICIKVRYILSEISKPEMLWNPKVCFSSTNTLCVLHNEQSSSIQIKIWIFSHLLFVNCYSL